MIDDFENIAAEAEAIEKKEDSKLSIVSNNEGVGSPPPPLPSTADILIGFYKPILAVMLPHWKVTEDEIIAVSDAQAAAIDAYWPEGFINDTKLMLVFTAVAATAGVVLPRLKANEKKKQQAGPSVVPEGKYKW